MSFNHQRPTKGRAVAIAQSPAPLSALHIQMLVVAMLVAVLLIVAFPARAWEQADGAISLSESAYPLSIERISLQTSDYGFPDQQSWGIQVQPLADLRLGLDIYQLDSSYNNPLVIHGLEPALNGLPVYLHTPDAITRGMDMVVSYDIGGFSASLSLNHQGAYYPSLGNKLSGEAVLTNLQLNYGFTNGLNLSIGGNNIFGNSSSGAASSAKSNLLSTTLSSEEFDALLLNSTGLDSSYYYFKATYDF